MGTKTPEVPADKTVGDALLDVHEKASKEHEERKKAPAPKAEAKPRNRKERRERKPHSSKGNAATPDEAALQAIEAKINFKVSKLRDELREKLDSELTEMKGKGIPGRLAIAQKGLTELGTQINGDEGLVKQIEGIAAHLDGIDEEFDKKINLAVAKAKDEIYQHIAKEQKKLIDKVNEASEKADAALQVGVDNKSKLEELEEDEVPLLRDGNDLLAWTIAAAFA